MNPVTSQKNASANQAQFQTFVATLLERVQGDARRGADDRSDAVGDVANAAELSCLLKQLHILALWHKQKLEHLHYWQEQSDKGRLAEHAGQFAGSPYDLTALIHILERISRFGLGGIGQSDHHTLLTPLWAAIAERLGSVCAFAMLAMIMQERDRNACSPSPAPTVDEVWADLKQILMKYSSC